ncbi:hypothetical protein EJB05_44540, partial [Eragrostis curvula]
MISLQTIAADAATPIRSPLTPPRRELCTNRNQRRSPLHTRARRVLGLTQHDGKTIAADALTVLPRCLQSELTDISTNVAIGSTSLIADPLNVVIESLAKLK